MRMRELVEKSGLPKTTIHYYLKEGLLPRPISPSKNSAIYTEAHLERLDILKRLRTPEMGPLPFAAIRRVLELIDQGVEPDVAILLQKTVVGGLAAGSERRGPFTFEELAETSGASANLLRDAVDVGLIVPAPGTPTPMFDELDLRVATMLASIAAPFGFRMEELAPIGDLIRQVSAIEMDLRNRVTQHADQNTAAQISAQFQDAGNFLHAYLFLRARQQDIAQHGLGTAEDQQQNKETHPHD